MSTPVSPADRYAAARRRAAEDGPELSAFRSLYDFEFDDFQVRACRALSGGHGVLLAAPTGSGKTVVGEFAVHLALAEGRKCFYTTPIKALSNQKYADLVRRYSVASVGLLTGDNSINGEAPVVVMTTEVLRNMLYAGSPTLASLGYVVLDEVHYLADRFRGAVWEEVIIHLPESVRLVALSATVSNAEEFGDWLAQVRGGTTVIVDEHRPVPLWQHMLAGGRLYDLFTTDYDVPAKPGTPRADRGPAATSAERTGRPRAMVNPELLRIAQRDQWAATKAPGRPGRGGRRQPRIRITSRPDVISRLDAAGLLPAITFIFSRAGCDAAVRQCLAAGLRLTTPAEAAEITELAERYTADIPREDLPVLGYGEWLLGLQRGIAAHHAGLLPTFKQVVEELFTAGLVRAVFATETLALGINMPARTVVIERLDKWNGETHAHLTPGEYTQLTGRAGRRGIDVEGHAVIRWQPGDDPAAVAGLAGTRTYPLSSSFQPSYNMAVNLVGQVGRERASALLESSFAQFQADRAVAGIARQARLSRKSMGEAAVHCHLGDFAGYMAIRRELSQREGNQAKRQSADRRAEAARSLQRLRRGDIIRVPSGRRAGIAVVLDAFAGGMDEPSPLVLTANRQVKRLSIADFPVPVEAIQRIRIPASFSVRSANHRRDLAATMRNKLAGADLGSYRRNAAGAGRGADDDGADDDGADNGADGGADGGRGAGGEEAEISRLRRRLRQHPCHGCQDREEHARQAEQYLRMQRHAEALEGRVAGRTHVIARTFDQVCGVLAELGYLDGDRVTAEGSRLASLYTELDLLAAECLRRGLWDALTPAELAACVSALTFESRRPEDAAPPRLPGGRVREVLAGLVRVWNELDGIEHDHRLSFLREPDMGFAWHAHAWAQGRQLEAVLATGLTPGDFVRAAKQLIDLLDQVAVAAGPGKLSATARSAIHALRRGVVAYSAVG
jgi:ATP-dependent RNA helicase HelY